jgi:hypothetical protein
MDSADRSSITADDRQQPLNPSGAMPTMETRTTRLNDRLNTAYVDVEPGDDSFGAHLTRLITGFVGEFVTPRRMLVILRVLKAITFCFLILTVAADLMYIAFCEIFATKDVRMIVGGSRDMIIRIYGLVLATMAILIELDITHMTKAFYGFRGFIPRSLLLFFISAITGSHPMQENQVERNYDLYYDDYVMDDQFANVVSSEIPDSAVVFQMVTSFIL